jgi:hypothetical protein
MFLTCYAPVRHWGIATPVRLACVRHAASVRPEPGSNSPMRIRYSSSRTTGCSQSSESRQSLQTLIVDLLRGQRINGFRTPVDSTAHHLSKSISYKNNISNFLRCCFAAAHKVSRTAQQSQVFVLDPLDCPSIAWQKGSKGTANVAIASRRRKGPEYTRTHTTVTENGGSARSPCSPFPVPRGYGVRSSRFGSIRTTQMPLFMSFT